MSTNKVTITLRSSDEEIFEVEKAVALESETIKHIMEELDCEKSVIPLPNVTSKILAKVIEYCKKHVVVVVDDKKELKEWDEEFLKDVDQATLFDLILAANYLNIKKLLDITCQQVADMIQDKQPEYVRKLFNIQNDYTEEEEKQVRNDNAWAFEGVKD